MSVAIAGKVLGSEVRLALIRYFRTSPGSQADAVEALDLPQTVVSRNTAVLVQAGVVIADPPGGGGKQGRYVVDEERLAFLVSEVARYSLSAKEVRALAAALIKPREPAGE